jgi:hypothetical protein
MVLFVSKLIEEKTVVKFVFHSVRERMEWYSTLETASTTENNIGVTCEITTNSGVDQCLLNITITEIPSTDSKEMGTGVAENCVSVSIVTEVNPSQRYEPWVPLALHKGFVFQLVQDMILQTLIRIPLKYL